MRDTRSRFLIVLLLPLLACALAGALPGEARAAVQVVKFSTPVAPDHPNNIAALKFAEIVKNVETILAIELMCAAQGLEFLKPLRPGPRLAEPTGGRRSSPSRIPTCSNSPLGKILLPSRRQRG